MQDTIHEDRKGAERAAEELSAAKTALHAEWEQKHFILSREVEAAHRARSDADAERERMSVLHTALQADGDRVASEHRAAVEKVRTELQEEIARTDIKLTEARSQLYECETELSTARSASSSDKADWERQIHELKKQLDAQRHELQDALLAAVTAKQLASEMSGELDAYQERQEELMQDVISKTEELSTAKTEQAAHVAEKTLEAAEKAHHTFTDGTAQTNEDVSVVADSTLLEMSTAAAQLMALQALHEEQSKALSQSMDNSARHLMQAEELSDDHAALQSQHKEARQELKHTSDRAVLQAIHLAEALDRIKELDSLLSELQKQKDHNEGVYESRMVQNQAQIEVQKSDFDREFFSLEHALADSKAQNQALGQQQRKKRDEKEREERAHAEKEQKEQRERESVSMQGVHHGWNVAREIAGVQTHEQTQAVEQLETQQTQQTEPEKSSSSGVIISRGRRQIVRGAAALNQQQAQALFSNGPSSPQKQSSTQTRSPAGTPVQTQTDEMDPNLILNQHQGGSSSDPGSPISPPISGLSYGEAPAPPGLELADLSTALVPPPPPALLNTPPQSQSQSQSQWAKTQHDQERAYHALEVEVQRLQESLQSAQEEITAVCTQRDSLRSGWQALEAQVLQQPIQAEREMKTGTGTGAVESKAAEGTGKFDPEGPTDALRYELARVSARAGALEQVCTIQRNALLQLCAHQAHTYANNPNNPYPNPNEVWGLRQALSCLRGSYETEFRLLEGEITDLRDRERQAQCAYGELRARYAEAVHRSLDAHHKDVHGSLSTSAGSALRLSGSGGAFSEEKSNTNTNIYDSTHKALSESQSTSMRSAFTDNIAFLKRELEQAAIDSRTLSARLSQERSDGRRRHRSLLEKVTEIVVAVESSYSSHSSSSYSYYMNPKPNSAFNSSAVAYSHEHELDQDRERERERGEEEQQRMNLRAMAESAGLGSLGLGQASASQQFDQYLSSKGSGNRGNNGSGIGSYGHANASQSQMSQSQNMGFNGRGNSDSVMRLSASAALERTYARSLQEEEEDSAEEGNHSYAYAYSSDEEDANRRTVDDLLLKMQASGSDSSRRKTSKTKTTSKTTLRKTKSGNSNSKSSSNRTHSLSPHRPRTSSPSIGGASLRASHPHHGDHSHTHHEDHGHTRHDSLYSDFDNADNGDKDIFVDLHPRDANKADTSAWLHPVSDQGYHKLHEKRFGVVGVHHNITPKRGGKKTKKK